MVYHKRRNATAATCLFSVTDEEIDEDRVRDRMVPCSLHVPTSDIVRTRGTSVGCKILQGHVPRLQTFQRILQQTHHRYRSVSFKSKK